MTSDSLFYQKGVRKSHSPVVFGIVLQSLIASSFSATSQVVHYDAYYITHARDTIKGILHYSDITRLQDSITFITGTGVRLRLTPYDIRGFGIRLPYTDLNYTPRPSITDFRERASVAKYGYEMFDLYGISHSLPFDTKRVDFESIHLPSGPVLFVRRISAPGEVRFFEYYYAHHVSRHFSIRLSMVLLVTKSDMLFAKKRFENQRRWVARVVADYPALSQAVIKKQLNQGPLVNTGLVVSTYNEWHRRKSDSTAPHGVEILEKDNDTLIQTGIADANSLYNSNPMFIKTFIGTSAILIPGLIIAGHYSLQPLKPVWPPDCRYCSNKLYKEAYLTRAEAKKKKAVEHGLLYGFIVALGLTTLMAGD